MPNGNSPIKNKYIGKAELFLVACYWLAAGKKVRAKNLFRRIFISWTVSDYNNKVAPKVCLAHAFISEKEEMEMKAEIKSWTNPPLISIVMPTYNTDPDALREAIFSVKDQIYQNWELCIADDCSTSTFVRTFLQHEATQDERIKVVFREENGHICDATNSALDLARGEYVAFMDHDDVLPRHALYHVAKEIQYHPEVDLIYSDEDKIREDGSLSGPHFKSDWNEELFLTQNYINHLGVYRTSIIHEVGGLRKGFEGSQDHDFTLRFVAKTEASRIRHIPKILYHWRAYNGSGSFSDSFLDRAVDARRRAVREYLANKYPEIETSVISGPYGCNKVVRELPSPCPHVTIIIPTRDQVNYLQKCITSIFDKTSYPRYDVIIVNNRSLEEETLKYFSEIKSKYNISTHDYDGDFNYSAINNFAVTLAKGSILAFINNDIEVIDAQWLREMVCHATQENIGAVGAKLLYANGSVQHAGIILGASGVANHAFHGYPSKSTGYQARLQLPQYISAVTGACLVIEKTKFIKVGGFDDKELKVAYNDVDLCLKLAEQGLNNVYTPYATLYHHESVSRGSDTSPSNSERLKSESEALRARWGKSLDIDPFYNPNFLTDSATFKFRT